MTHVFVVNEQSFNTHLQYMFAGTGYRDNDLSCIVDSRATSTEKTLFSMIADISKLQIGDKVLFYVTGCRKFFGVFEVAGKPFYEPFLPEHSNYLYSELGKNLSFRVFIKPFCVYPEGISEHEALDEILDVEHPYQMCWSLIYRKLSGLRGCTYLTDSESVRMIDLIRQKNCGKALCAAGFKYDADTQTIKEYKECKPYTGCSDNYLTEIVKKRIFEITNSFEVHLQAYIIQNLDAILHLFGTNSTVWLGNEVVCSVGEQRIDILLISKSDSRTIISIIELKDGRPTAGIIETQIPWYIKWADQYVAPNYKEAEIEIRPIIIAAKYKSNSKNKRAFEAAKANYQAYFPTTANSTVTAPQYISFSFDSDTVSFQVEP